MDYTNVIIPNTFLTNRTKDIVGLVVLIFLSVLKINCIKSVWKCCGDVNIVESKLKGGAMSIQQQRERDHAEEKRGKTGCIETTLRPRKDVQVEILPSSGYTSPPVVTLPLQRLNFPSSGYTSPPAVTLPPPAVTLPLQRVHHPSRGYTTPPAVTLSLQRLCFSLQHTYLIQFIRPAILINTYICS
jgi:hypothetical protein